VSNGENYNYKDTCAQTPTKEAAPFWITQLDRAYGIDFVRFDRAPTSVSWNTLFSVADLVTMSTNTAIQVFVGYPCNDERLRIGLPAVQDSTGRCGWTLCGQTSKFQFSNSISCRSSEAQGSTRQTQLLLPEGEFVKIVLTGPEKYQLAICDVAVWGGLRGFDVSCGGGSCTSSVASLSASANREDSVSEASTSGQSNSILNVLPLALAGVAGVLALALIALGVRYKYVKAQSKTQVEPVDSETASRNPRVTAVHKEGTSEWVLESVRQME